MTHTHNEYVKCNRIIRGGKLSHTFTVIRLYKPDELPTHNLSFPSFESSGIKTKSHGRAVLMAPRSLTLKYEG